MSDNTFRSLFSRPATPGSNGSSSGGSHDDTSASSREVRPDVLPGATIRVLGAGGAGGNAVANMVRAKLPGVEFIAVNTDAQALYHNPAASKITIGRGTTSHCFI